MTMFTDEEEGGEGTNVTENHGLTTNFLLGQHCRAPPHFEGFATWDCVLQEWADEVQEYLEKAQAELGENGYTIGNFGCPPATAATSLTSVANSTTSTAFANANDTNSMPQLQLLGASQSELAVSKKKKKKKISLPIPEPAKLGELVLPHMDISDLSKCFLIVTMASLPWWTSTAINIPCYAWHI